MNIATSLPTILAGIQAAIGAAPQVVQLVTDAKNWITGLLGAGIITAEQQTALHDWVDSIASMSKLGIIPPSWQVQPDPK
jgi:hypothetical protein